MNHPHFDAIWAPPVFIARFVLIHVRVLNSADGLRAELWEHGRRAPQRLLWTERLAILGKSDTDEAPSGPRLVSAAVLPAVGRA